MQKIVIISRALELLKEPYYHKRFKENADNSPKARHLMQFIAEDLVRNKGAARDHAHVQYINKIIGDKAPQAKDSIYRTENNTTKYIDRLVEYLEGLCEKENPYRMFREGDDKQIILLLWDKVPVVSSGFISKEKNNRLSLVIQICKDCGIEPSSGDTGNILYIHDEEWGLKKDVQLYTPTARSEDINESEYLEMKHYFDFAIAFQHISVDQNITTYDLIRHGFVDRSKTGRINEMDNALENGKSFKDAMETTLK